MAGYRQLHTRIWSDTWFTELSPEYKLLFVYLFGNERTSLSGIYELPLKIISFETGLSRETIRKGLEVYIKADKVAYDFSAGVVWVKNLKKYQSSSSSPTLKRRIKADIKAVPECKVKEAYMISIGYRYRIDTLNIDIDSNLIKDSDSPKEETLSPEKSLQNWIEEFTGFPIPPTPENIKALDEMLAMGVIRADIEGAVAWWHGEGKVARTPAQLLGSVKFQVGKRTQSRARAPAAAPDAAWINVTELRLAEEAGDA